MEKLLTNFESDRKGGEIPHASESHEEATVREFKEDPQQAAAYLAEVAGEGDPEEVLLALRRINAAFDSDVGLNMTQDFKQTVAARVNREPAFAAALLDEAKALFLRGEPTVAMKILGLFYAARA